MSFVQVKCDTNPDKTCWDTLQKYLFFASSWQKCLPSQIKRPFPRSPIAMLFAVTQECTRELLGQNNIAQGVGRGATLFRLDKMVAWREIEKYMEMSQQFCPGL